MVLQKSKIHKDFSPQNFRLIMWVADNIASAYMPYLSTTV